MLWAYHDLDKNGHLDKVELMNVVALIMEVGINAEGDKYKGTKERKGVKEVLRNMLNEDNFVTIAGKMATAALDELAKAKPT